MSQPLELHNSSDPHEEIFLVRFSRLRAWALQITQNDRELSEDLVQDAFVHFTLLRPDLTRLQNPDGYLYSMLRNLNVSHLRRRQRLKARALSAAEYESAPLGIRATDPRDLLRLQDELRACCDYACIRKESSKMGSVLILRFVHGYYPREIALVMNCSREAVEERLRVARSEARQYLKQPNALRFIRNSRAHQRRHPRVHAGFALTTDALLHDLRSMIFEARTGKCLTTKLFERLYGNGAKEVADCATLAHVVCCPECLDRINRELGLPPLSERYPVDTLEKEPRSREKDDDEGGGNMTGSSGELEDFHVRAKRRALEVSEHRPQELCISVNGRLLASQGVNAAHNDQTLTVPTNEPLQFIEIISEQEVLLLFLDLSDQRLDDGSERTARVSLSDERSLEARVDLDCPSPKIHVTYIDPLFISQPLCKEYPVAEAAKVRRVADTLNETEQRRAGLSLFGILSAFRTLSSAWQVGRNFLLRPAPASAVISILLISALLLVRFHVPAVSAAELLRRSTQKEVAVAEDPDLVLHRTLLFEERASNGETIERRRIDAWQSASRGVKLRRFYDEQDNLIAGVWTKSDGRGVVYRRNKLAQELTPQGLEPNVMGNLWLVDLSAKDFSTLTGNSESTNVEETNDSYVLSYKGESRDSNLINASLKLSKADLRALEQRLVIQREGEAREYRFVEVAYKQLPMTEVTPIVFEPDDVLGLPTVPVNSSNVPEKLNSANAPSNALTPSYSPMVASTELEVEVTYLLNQIKADLGEQVSLTKTASGSLRVGVLAETEERKVEVLRALRSVSTNPAVILDVRTVEEVMRAQRKESNKGQVVTREVDVQAARIPAHEDLRGYFALRLGDDEDRIEDAIKQLAARSIGHSRQALLHASALRRLAGRFSSEDLSGLTPEARQKWLSMIVQHARVCQREIELMRGELAPIFRGSSGSSERVTVDQATLLLTAERLLQLSHSHDEVVRSVFTIPAFTGSTTRLKSERFWRSLETAAEMAAAIQRLE